MNYGELKKEAVSLPKDTPCAYAVWRAEDVDQRAGERGVVLREGEAERVLEGMHQKHDCCVGLNWGVMDCWIDEVVGRRTK